MGAFVRDLIGVGLAEPWAKHLGEDDGWIPVNEEWVYASAVTVTVPSREERFPFGCKVRLTQGGAVKYFYGLGISSSTTLTLTGGSDYTVANSAITAISISHATRPLYFPSWFNWTPTLVGFSANPSNAKYRFCLIGRECFCNIEQPSAGTSNATTFTISLPISAANLGYSSSEAVLAVPLALMTDNDVTTGSQGYATISQGSEGTLQLYPGYGASWTSSGGKRARLKFSYEV